MADGTVLCRRCGSPNAEGDQFCGTCGAFLEWEGESVEAERTDATGARAADAPESTAASAPMATTTPATPAVPASPGVDPSEPGVTCASCGRTNPAGRTFCQACGTRLAGGTAASTGPPAAAPQPARPSAVPAGTRPAVRPGGSGGLPGWLPVVVVLGLVVGVGAVAASVLLRQTDLPSAVSFEPATPPATLTPTLSPASPGESAAASGGESAAPSAATAVALMMTGATASSVVGDRPMFAPGMVVDGDLATSWQEGADDEAGQWIEVTFEPARLDYVVVYSGYQLSHDAFLANRRPKDVTVSVDGAAPQAFLLADTEQPQRIDVGDVPGASRVRITIVSTYDPQATDYPGSPFDDMAISEIRAFGVQGG